MKYGWLLLPLLMIACGKPTLVDQEVILEKSIWAYTDTLSWDFEVADTNALYDLELTVTHQKDFRYQNCYVRFHTGFPGGETIEQVVSLDFQTEGGRWLGKCRSDNCQVGIPIQHQAFFNQPGKHQLRLEQFMREDSLKGIEAFHLRIVDTGQRREG